MALTKCKECGKDVSTDAKTCPGCGAPTPKKTGWFTKLVAGLFVIGALGAIFGGKDAGNSSAPPKPRVKSQAELDEDSRFALARATYKGLKSTLRDPESLVVEKLLTNEKGTVACAQYRAKNGFGGYNKEAIVVADNTVHKATTELMSKHCKAATFDLTGAAS